MDSEPQLSLIETFSPTRLERPIAITNGETVGVRELLGAAAVIRRQLRAAADGTWGIHTSSPLQQIATLTALQSLGRKAVLLPHAEVEFLDRISPDFSGILTESEACNATTTQIQALNTLIDEGFNEKPLVCAWQQPIGFMTSGSSGEPTTIFRTPAQILAEVQLLERAFGGRISADRLFHGTTSHQHLYGFTFRVMWPFLTGRLFADVQIGIPSDISRAINAHEHIVLISSPAFLSRARHLLDFEQLAAAHFIAFSSGSPLDADTAMHFNRREKINLVEIYGSTETGALASRIVESTSEAGWRSLPDVEVDIFDHTLCARGPHLTSSDWCKTEDRAEWNSSGGFDLRGRTDQIVKVADKRVSLTELERLATSRADIHAARILLLPGGALGCAIVPSDAGWEALRLKGKAVFVGAIRDDLARSVERVTTPKRWRILKRLPVNTQGKVELPTLQKLFQLSPTIVWRVLRHDNDHWVGTAEINSDLPVLDGHFPGEPIVPGVAQISWAAGAAREAFDLDQLSGDMERVKFRNTLRPGVCVQLSLSLDRVKQKVHFDISDDQRNYSIGQLKTTL
jgi:3-hydroxymyristoyl/3-hydroxydecanoyl-(acyl carrier protein) dehydratase